MHYAQLKTWEDFAKALCQNPDPRSLTYLVEGLNRALEKDKEDERKILLSHRDPMQPKEGQDADRLEGRLRARFP